MTLDEKVTFFFTSPEQPTEAGTYGSGTYSSLFLVRREAQDCLIGKVLHEDAVVEEAMRGEHRLFATLMVVMAGVDLLAKFYAGSDEVGGVSARIRNFAARYMFPTSKDPGRSALVLYLGLRNPLLHSFTLYDQQREIWLVNRRPDFDILENPEKPDHFLVSVEGVYLAFVRGLRAYHEELVGNDDLRNRFESMYEKYGSTGMGILPEAQAS